MPYEEERSEIVQVIRALYSTDAEAGYAELRLSPGQPGVRIPVTLLDLLASACFLMQFGAPIKVRRLREELTLDEAVDLLGLEEDVLSEGIASRELHPVAVDTPELSSEDVLTLLRRKRGGALLDVRDLLPPDSRDA